MSGDDLIERRIGERIRARRMALGLTQEQLGQALGISYQQIQKYESGVNRITAARLMALSGRLGVPVTFFFDSEASPPQIMGGLGEITDHGGKQRAALDAARSFAAIQDADVRQAVAGLLRVVADRQG